VDYSGSRLGVSASLAQHAGHLGDAEGDTYDTIENLIGSIKADTLEGDDSTNLLIGGAGADVLKGNGGTDTVDYSGSSSGVSVSIADNNNHFGDAEGDTFDRIENLNGSSHDDILAGDAVANIISGGQGNDSWLGRTGNDTLIGGEGNDSLSGGPGADTLTGSTGADTFIYQITPLDTGPTIDTCDFISDFEHGTDKIDLSTMDAALNKPGNDAFTFISGGFTDSGQVRVIHDVHQVNGQIFGSTFVHMNTDASPDVSIGVEYPASIGVQYLATLLVVESVVQGVHERDPRAAECLLWPTSRRAWAGLWAPLGNTRAGERSGAVLEPPALVSGLQDVAVMSEPVEQGGGHLGIATEHRRPFGEPEVGGDEHRSAGV
jgi:hypothetical protein